MGTKFNPLTRTIEELRTVREFWFNKWQQCPTKWKQFCWDMFQYTGGLVRKKWNM